MCIRAPTEGWSATNELFPRQRERSRGISLGLAASPEGDSTILGANDATIGNRSARQVAGQVFHHMFRSAPAMRRAFDEHIPVGFVDGIEPGFEFAPIVKLGPFVLQFQFARRHQATKTGGELLAKDTPQFDVSQSMGLGERSKCWRRTCR